MKNNNNYYNAKRSIFKSYLEFIFIILFLFLIIRIVQKGFLPDIFGLSAFTNETTKKYFELIWQITASIFAILMAVITFGYELIGKSSRRRKRFNIFNRWKVIAYSSLAVATILLSFYSTFTIDNLNSVNDLTTAYFIGILFVFFILFLFIFTVWLLSLSDTTDEIVKIIDNSIEFEDFKEDITDELVYYIQEHDNFAYSQKILPHLNKHCISLIDNASDSQKTNDTLNNLVKIWEAGILESIRVGEQQYFNSIWVNIQKLYEHASRNRSQLLNYSALESFIRQQIELLSINNNISGLSNCAKVLSSIYLDQLKFNCPPQDSINGLYWAYENKNAPNSCPETDLQWGHINEFIWLQQQIYNAAINLHSKYLFEVVSFELSTILNHLKFNTSIQLGVYQESFITLEIYSFEFFSTLKALENEIFRSSIDNYNIRFSGISDYIKAQKFFSTDILLEIENFILACQKLKKLDITTVKELGGLSRVISMDFENNQTVQNGLLTIIEIFKKLKNEIEMDSNYHRDRNYNQIKLELESLKTCLNQLKIESKTRRATKRINQLLGSF